RQSLRDGSTADKYEPHVLVRLHTVMLNNDSRHLIGGAARRGGGNRFPAKVVNRLESLLRNNGVVRPLHVKHQDLYRQSPEGSAERRRCGRRIIYLASCERCDAGAGLHCNAFDLHTFLLRSEER